MTAVISKDLDEFDPRIFSQCKIPLTIGVKDRVDFPFAHEGHAPPVVGSFYDDFVVSVPS